MAIIWNAVASTSPVTLASDRFGNLYGVNGLARGWRYSGGTKAVTMGIAAGAAVSASSVTPATYYVSDVVVNDPGSNYSTPPAVVIAGVAAAKARLNGGGVESVAIQLSATTHAAAPFVEFSGGQETGGSVTITNTGGVAGVDVNANNALYASAPEVTFFANTSGVLGSVVEHRAARGRCVLRAAAPSLLASVIITDPGSYTALSTLPSGASPVGATVAAGTFGTAALAVRFSGIASAATIDTSGTKYTEPPVVTISSQGPLRAGGGAAVECTVSKGSLAAATVAQPGSGYDGRIVATLSSPKAAASATMRPVLQGKYLCAIRYADSTPESRGGPNYGNTGPLLEVDCGDGAAGIIWKNLPQSNPDPLNFRRITHLELWRTTGDQAITLYRVARYAFGSVPAQYADSKTDSELVSGATYTPTLSVVGLTITDGGSGYTSAPTVTISGSGGATAVAIVDTSTNTVSALSLTNIGSGYTSTPTVAFSGGGGSGAKAVATLGTVAIPVESESVALPILTADGYPSSERFGIPPADMSVMCFSNDRAWYAVSDTRPNTICFSEVDEPESVPDAYELTLQPPPIGSDKITGLFTLSGVLYAALSRNICRLVVTGHPLEATVAAYVAQRGMLNQRCFDIYDGIAYIADGEGVYAFDGSQVSSLSDPVSTFWSEPRADFSSAQWFSVHVDPQDKVVRFYYRTSSDSGPLPRRALCYSLITKAWWTESYADAVGTQITTSHTPRPVMLLGSSSGGVGCLMRQSGITDNGSDVSYSLKTGNLPLGADPQRGVRITYTPTASKHNLGVSCFYNDSSTARANAVSANTGTGVISTQGSTVAEIDLHKARSGLGPSNGTAHLTLAGRMDDKSAGGDRHLAIGFSGTQNYLSSGKVIVHRLEIEGVG